MAPGGTDGSASTLPFPNPPAVDQREALRSPFLAVAALSSGAALVVAIAFHRSLALTLGTFTALAGGAAAARISRLPTEMRRRLGAQALAGARIGLAATVAYDASRWLLVTFGHLAFRPFDTFYLFGYALLGRDASRSAALLAGTAYHYLNGLAFAVAYCLLLGGRRWPAGVAWALGLEAAMFTLYPGWLDLKAVMREFALVSVTGHLAYGATLGVLGQDAAPLIARRGRGG